MLDPLKGDESATLTLQVVDGGSEADELLTAVAVRKMIQFLLVCDVVFVSWFNQSERPVKLTGGRAQMLVQGSQLTEGAGAEVALVCISVPGLTGGLVLGGAGPSDQLLGHHAVGISGPDEIVKLIAVEVWGRPAATLFDVMGKSWSCREIISAEGTSDVVSAVQGRVQML
jgi:hypothetical protein